MEAIVSEYGKVWYDDKYIVNVFSLANLVHKYIVIYDSHQYDVFTVHINRGIIKFSINKQGLYVFKPTYAISNYNSFTTVE